MEKNILQSSYEFDVSKIKGHTISSYMFKLASEQVANGYDREWLINSSTGNSILVSHLEENARRIASGLFKLGFRRGDVLLYQTLNSCELFQFLVGVWTANGSVRGIHLAETSDDLTRDLNDCRAKFVLCDTVTAAKVKPAVERANHDVVILSFGELEGATLVDKLLDDDGSACPVMDVDPRTFPAVILSTSGTTGRPKGAAHSHFGFLANIGCPGIIHSDTKTLNLFPNFHLGGIAVALITLFFNGTAVAVEELPAKEDTILKAVQKYKVDSICCIPWHLPLFSRSPAFTPETMESVVRIVTGGAVITKELKKGLLEKFPNIKFVHEVYGMTEILISVATGTACIYGSEKERERNLPLGTPGKLMPGYKLKCVDETTGQTLGANKTGDIYVTGHSVLLGYINNPKQTALVKSRDGWVCTGDCGHYDEDGFIFITGRKKDIFKVNGLHVSPAELEDILLRHPAVKDCAVAGIPVEVGCLAKAFVVRNDENESTAEEIQNFVDEQVADYKKLKGGVVFLDNIERTATGKISGKFLEQCLKM